MTEETADVELPSDEATYEECLAPTTGIAERYLRYGCSLEQYLDHVVIGRALRDAETWADTRDVETETVRRNAAQVVLTLNGHRLCLGVSETTDTVTVHQPDTTGFDRDIVIPTDLDGAVLTSVVESGGVIYGYYQDDGRVVARFTPSGMADEPSPFDPSGRFQSPLGKAAVVLWTVERDEPVSVHAAIDYLERRHDKTLIEDCCAHLQDRFDGVDVVDTGATTAFINLSKDGPDPHMAADVLLEEALGRRGYDVDVGSASENGTQQLQLYHEAVGNPAQQTADILNEFAQELGLGGTEATATDGDTS